MAEISKIQWTDATWNVARGCSKVDEDCKFCYMYRQSLDGTRYEPKEVIKTKTVFNLPLKLKEPSLVFTSSLTDFFHPDIDSYRHEAWDIIRRCPQHTFQILTKRPERIREHLPADWGEGWDNVWLGTSVGSQKSAHRIIRLLEAPAKVRFLSLEPIHSYIDLKSVKELVANDGTYTANVLTGTESKWNPNGPDYGVYSNEPTYSPIDWVIVGGESGNDNGKYRYRECKIQWIEELVHDCKKAGVPVFVKQLGTHLAKAMKLSDRHGGIMEEWPEHLQVRQMPKVYQSEPVFNGTPSHAL